MRSETLTPVVIDQALHGYTLGHSLIATSRKLPREAERVMLVLSDLSGPTMLRGFESYITGYPIPGTSVYALARTWYAPEMDRPGCVWTHTLLLDFTQLASVSSATDLLGLFTRPQTPASGSEYEAKLVVRRASAELLPSSVPGRIEEILQLMSGLYSSPAQNVLIEAASSSEYEQMVLLAWSQQWPALRGSFKFCTGALDSRTLHGLHFDLQVVPRENFSKVISRIGPSALPLRSAYPRPDTSAWIESAADDLARPGPLRRYMWALNEGLETNASRRSFRQLARLFALTSSVQPRHDAIEQVVEFLATEFPRPQQASGLKKSIIGERETTWSVSRDQASEVRLLRKLLTTQRLRAFNPADLGMRARAVRLMKEDTNQALAVAHDAIAGLPSPLKRAYLEGTAEGMGRELAPSLYRRDRELFLKLLEIRPALAESVDLWRLPQQSIQPVLDALFSIERRRRIPLKSIARAVIEADSAWAGSRLIERYPRQIVPAILNWLDGALPIRLRFLSIEWRQSLAGQSQHIRPWVAAKKRRSTAAMQYLATFLDPTDPHNLKLGAKLWIPHAAHAIAQSEGGPLIEAVAFWLSLALRNPGIGSDQLASLTFQVVHDAAMRDRIPSQAWEFIARKLPRLPWWRAWDKCERLRRGLARCFAVYKWSTSMFLEAVKDPQTFDSIIAYCFATPRLRPFLTGLITDIQSGLVRPESFQQEVLRNREVRPST